MLRKPSRDDAQKAQPRHGRHVLDSLGGLRPLSDGGKGRGEESWEVPTVPGTRVDICQEGEGIFPILRCW